MRLLYILFVCLTVLTGCSGGGGGGSDSGGTFTTGRDTPKRVAIDDYLNKVVLPVLTSADSHATALRNQIAILLANPSDANLTNAKAAWASARVPWQRNQSTNFGPVVTGGFNTKLDSWPLDNARLQVLLSSQADLSESAVTAFDGDLKGYHLIEYILWGENGIKRPTEITQREAQLLTSVAAVLRKDTAALLDAWNKNGNPYALEVALAGQGSETFPTEDLMLETAVRGMLAVLDELSEVLLAEDDFRDVESHYSGNTLNEFVDDVVGARDIYTIALSALVIDGDASLDLDIRGDFESAIAALRQIPEPFDAAIGSSSANSRIENARDRIRDLANQLRNHVLTLFVEPIQPVDPNGGAPEGGGDGNPNGTVEEGSETPESPANT